MVLNDGLQAACKGICSEGASPFFIGMQDQVEVTCDYNICITFPMNACLQIIPTNFLFSVMVGYINIIYDYYLISCSAVKSSFDLVLVGFCYSADPFAAVLMVMMPPEAPLDSLILPK